MSPETLCGTYYLGHTHRKIKGKEFFPVTRGLKRIGTTQEQINERLKKRQNQEEVKLLRQMMKKAVNTCREPFLTRYIKAVNARKSFLTRAEETSLLRQKKRIRPLRCPECNQIFLFQNSVGKKKAIKEKNQHLVECHNYRICRVCNWPFKPVAYEKMCPKHKEGLKVDPKFQRLMQQRIKAGQKFQIS